MGALRRLLAAAALLAALGHASAQGGDPDLAEGDLDTAAPPPDDAYLADDGASGDPDLAEGDLDTSVPPADDAYLAHDPSVEGAPETSARRTPGPDAALALGAAGATALALAARRRA